MHKAPPPPFETLRLILTFECNIQVAKSLFIATANGIHDIRECVRACLKQPLAGLFLAVFMLGKCTYAQDAIVKVPVADLRSQPVLSQGAPSDPLEETQLLFGEHLSVLESSGEWVRVSAVQQPQFRHRQRWEGYPGWVLKTSLSFESDAGAPKVLVAGSRWFVSPNSHSFELLPLGSELSVKPSAPAQNQTAGLKPLPLAKTGDRMDILSSAQLLLDVPYLWGGLSPGSPLIPKERQTAASYGIDCSGLTYLSYRLQGVTIPRDSHEQWMKAKPIQRRDLRPADLIFSAKRSDPKKIVHVVMFAGDGGQLIEAPQTGMRVRRISFKEKFGADLSEVESGQTVGDRVIYFGSFLAP
jgi:gamma-D-glutamyl-L-lysine dipeptidyl-peptidase